MGWVDDRRGKTGRKLTSTITALMLIVRLVAIVVAVGVVSEADRAAAVDLPPIGSPLFLQTSGPNAGIGIGDWYSSPPPGGGTDHLFELDVPQLWPAGTPLTVALFDPELQVPDPVSPTAIDEIRGSGPDNATFTLLSPSGTVLTTVTYTPNGGTNGTWTELLTFSPDTHGTGTYLLRSTVSNNDDNSWRLAFDHDPDCSVTGTPGTCAPASLSDGDEIDNPDSSPGTGDELTIGIQRASYQHGGSGQSCKSFYFFVAPGTTSITLHNFDMDGNGSVNYHSPSGSSYAGSVSGNARWNNSSNATRVGDTLAIGASDRGWWSADVCISSGNQYIFEGVEGESVFLDLVPAVPRMTLTKSDGITSVDPGETVTYVLTYTNTSNSTPNPGLATGVTISDTIPANTTYQSCSVNGPATGSCSVSAGVVTYTLDNPILPGSSGTVSLTVDVNSGASGSVANSATLTFGDPLGNSYPPKLATDVDTVRTPQLTVNKSAAPGAVEPGEVITYTVDLVNSGGGTQTGVLITDDLPSGTSPVPGSTVVTRDSVATDNFQSNDYTGGSGWTGPWVESVDDGIAITGDIRIGTDLDASLRLGVGGRTGGPNQPRWIDRTFNGGGATSATLSFDYRSDNLEAGDFVYVEIYDGTTYHEVAALGDGANNATTQSFGPVDITGFVTATSAIRIITTALSHDNDRVWFDNIAISLSSTLAGGDPPTLLNNYSLDAGESVTVTYDVVVDNPATIADATNTAIARSDQSAPVSDSTTTTLTSSSIGDLVWNDLDADGFVDGGEPGIAGVTVDLTWAGPDATLGNGDDVSYPSQTTDGSGAYDFTGLPSGLFRVDVDNTTVPLGATLTTTADPLDVNVASGEDFNTADFGYRFPALGDVVWVDVDGDGIQDAGEAGLAGVTVTLFDGSDNQVGSPQVSAADGSYGFSGLALGDYYVVFDLSTIPGGGYLFTTPNVGSDDTVDSDADPITGRSQTVTLAVGQTQTTLDAGAYLPVTIGDVVYEDLNGNGTQDPGEPGIDGVTIDLLDAAGTTTVATTTTAGTGLYSFSTAPGSYQIEVNQTTLGLTTPVQTQGTNPQNVTLTSGQTNTAIDYGYYQPATLGNQVWVDMDEDGIQDGGEPGAGGITVNLLDAAGTSTLAITTTAGDGSYSFTGLAPGAYMVEFVTPGWTITTADQGSDDTLDSDPDPGTGRAPITLTSGQDETGLDAGLEPATLGDRVWWDANGNGIYNAGEAGQAGITVRLLTADGSTVLATTTTAADGTYSFKVAPGSYQIETDLTTAPAEYRFSPQDQGSDDTLDSDADPTTGRIPVTVTDGTDNLTYDTGMFKPPALGDVVWVDVDGDGIQDAGEAGLAGVTVTLFDGSDNQVGSPQVSAADGSYGFSGLALGDYYVVFDLSTIPGGGYLFTTPNVGSDDTVDSDADPITGRSQTVTLAVGQTQTTLDAGAYLPVTIGDVVYEDLNGNGTQDPGEPGIDGVTIDLLDAAGTTTVATTTTAGGGLYSFTTAPGSYQIEVNQTTLGLTTPVQTQGTNPQTVTLTSGQTNTAIDYGYYQPATLGNQVWVDMDEDGIQDGGEPGAAGITVNLLDAAGTSTLATTITAGDGSYSFTGLAPGAYMVEFVTPGWTITTADQGSDDTLDSDPDPGTGRAPITLTSGQDETGLDAGLEPATLGDRVWWDANGNGIYNAGEAGQAGITVRLLTADGSTVLATTTTAADGTYSFKVAPGSYQIETDLTTAPAEYRFSPQDQGSDDTLDSDADPTTGRIPVTVTDGTDNLTYDTGMFKPPALGDVVWVDVDGDGIQDAGEAGLAGVTVTLFDGSDNQVGSPQVSAADGSYGFSGLALGDYYVVFDLSTIPGGGYLFTTPNVGSDDTVDSDADPITGRSQTVTLAVGQTQTTLDAGAYLPVTIGDVVYEDLNGNGTQDPGEPGIDGVTIDLLDAAGTTTVATTTTAGGGLYSFTTAPGSYQIEVNQTTLGLTTPVQTQGTNPQTVTLTSGQTNTAIDYGYYQPATLGNQVWDDLNGNGIQDSGEPGIAGVTVTLLQGGTPVITDVTDATGGFGFNGLAPGTYQLEFDLTTNTAGRTYGFSPREQGGNPALDSNADRLDGMTAPFDLVSGSADDSVDAGAFANATIGDLVWEDLDDDGIQDPGEPGVEGVTVTLYNAVGDVVAATATAADGSYGFTAPPANYQLGFDLSTNTSGATYRFSTRGAGPDDTVDSDADPTTGLTALFSTTSGSVVDRMDAGAVAAASIGDSVWDDLNGDGIENAGEPGLAGVTVRLLDATGATELATTTTAGDGSYTFPNLDPGTYTIDVDDATLPAGAVETTGLDPLVVTVTSGEIEVTADFGYYQPATVGDLVWDDLSNDGIQDPGEPGLEGVTVNLLNAAGTVLATTATNASGGYTFAGLVPGQYRIGFDLSTEASAFFYELTIPYAGTDDALDSDPDPLTGLTGLNTLTSGMDLTTIDAGATVVNQLPTAVDDTDTTLEDTPVTVGVLGNDTDPDGGTLSVITVADPANGTATINPDNTITYTPDPDYHGTDSFEYTISDGQGGTDTATVTITITPVNDPPVANDDTNTTPEDVALLVAVPGVLGNDTDVDGDPVTVTGHTQPANGTVTVGRRRVPHLHPQPQLQWDRHLHLRHHRRTRRNRHRHRHHHGRVDQ